MNYKKMKSITVLICVFIINVLIAQNTINLHKTFNSNSTFNLNEIKNITFTLDNIEVNKTDGTVSILALIDINYLDFSVILTGLDLIQPPNINSNQYSIYPNPVKDYLNIEFQNSLLQPIILQIVGIDGKVVFTSKLINKKNSISTNSLSNGIYFCRLNNGIELTTLKFSKQ